MFLETVPWFTNPDVINAIGGQVIAVMIALGTLIGVIVNAVLTIRNGRKAEEIKVLANGTIAAERKRNQELTQLLSTTDVEIPPTDRDTDHV